MRRIVIGLSVLLILCCSTASLYAETDMGPGYQTGTAAPSPEAMTADALIVRPIGILAIFLGTAVAIVATPFAVTSGSTGQVYKTLVGQPFNFAIRRPLGEEP